MIPGWAEVVAAIFKLIVPTCRHGNGASFRKPGLPAKLLTGIFWVEAERPKLRKGHDLPIGIRLWVEHGQPRLFLFGKIMESALEFQSGLGVDLHHVKKGAYLHIFVHRVGVFSIRAIDTGGNADFIQEIGFIRRA